MGPRPAAGSRGRKWLAARAACESTSSTGRAFVKNPRRRDGRRGPGHTMVQHRAGVTGRTSRATRRGGARDTTRPEPAGPGPVWSVPDMARAGYCPGRAGAGGPRSSGPARRVCAPACAGSPCARRRDGAGGFSVVRENYCVCAAVCVRACDGLVGVRQRRRRASLAAPASPECAPARARARACCVCARVHVRVDVGGRGRCCRSRPRRRRRRSPSSWSCHASTPPPPPSLRGQACRRMADGVPRARRGPLWVRRLTLVTRALAGVRCK